VSDLLRTTVDIAMSVETETSKPGSKGRKAYHGPDYVIGLFHAWCKGCGLCAAFCPQDVYECNPDGKPELVKADACNGCQLCVLHCPDFAIRVEPADHDKGGK